MTFALILNSCCCYCLSVLIHLLRLDKRINNDFWIVVKFGNWPQLICMILLLYGSMILDVFTIYGISISIMTSSLFTDSDFLKGAIIWRPHDVFTLWPWPLTPWPWTLICCRLDVTWSNSAQNVRKTRKNMLLKYHIRHFIHSFVNLHNNNTINLHNKTYAGQQAILATLTAILVSGIAANLSRLSSRNLAKPQPAEKTASCVNSGFSISHSRRPVCLDVGGYEMLAVVHVSSVNRHGMVPVLLTNRELLSAGVDRHGVTASSLSVRVMFVPRVGRHTVLSEILLPILSWLTRCTVNAANSHRTNCSLRWWTRSCVAVTIHSEP